MKTSLVKSNFHKQLKLLLKTIPSKPQLPILSGIYIAATDEGCLFRTTDLSSGITIKTAAKVDEVGSVVIPGKQFIELVASLPEGEITIHYADEKVTISSGKNTTTFSSIDVSDYPDFPQVSGESISITKDIISSVQKRVVFSASTDQARPVLTSILFNQEDDQLKLVATDGFRLSTLQAGEGITLSNSFLIQAKIIQDIYKILEVSDGDSIQVTTDFDQKTVLFSSDDMQYFVRMIEGSFPPYQKIIPAESSVEVRCDVEELLEHVKRAQIFGRESSNIIQFKITDQTITVVSATTQVGEYIGSVTSAQVEGDDVTIAFNSRYIADFLQSQKSGELVFSAMDAFKPTKWEVVGEDNFLYVVMPFRLH